MQKRELLAWHKFPEPSGSSYHKTDLDRPEKVERLFDLCQILEAVIYDIGWQFLLKKYGVSGLLEINRRSGWFDENDDSEAIEDMKYQALICGYNIDTDQLGEYNEETSSFHPAT